MKRLAKLDPPFAEIAVGAEWPARGSAQGPPPYPAKRPADLLLVVHPGDAIEHPGGWGSREQARRAVAFGLANQAAMALEITRRLDADPTPHVVVLHRESSVQLEASRGAPRYESWVSPAYALAVARASASPAGASLYGDDLDAAAAWVVASGVLRPGLRVFMTGAYSGTEHGCIAGLGRALLDAEPGLEITVDPASPTDNANSEDRWSGGPDIQERAERRAALDTYTRAC